MPYSNFTLREVKQEFQLTLIEDQDLFSDIEPRDIREEFAQTLQENVPLALAINTEKARSELIISTILVELRRMFDRKISLFSGVNFTVDEEKNLTGFCDFIIGRSAEQLFITSPVIAIVEAKNENIIGGLGQCIAEMIAAKVFNEQEDSKIAWIYGTVTTGSAWKFLKLNHNTVYIDVREYYVENVEKIIGILSAMIDQEGL